MPKSRITASKSMYQELPWQAHLHALRVLLTAMVLVMLLINDAVCRKQPSAHFWLILVGVTYPHIGHLMFRRVEGRHRRGYTVFVFDGLFSGAVMAAIGLASVPSTILVAINLFNWMLVGGPILIAMGVTAGLAGIALAGAAATWSPASACATSDALAGLLLIGYFLVVAGIIHRHIGNLRVQQVRYQSKSDATLRARKRADRTLFSLVPASARDLLAKEGELPTQTLDATTLLMVEFTWEGSKSPSVADIADCFQVCEAVTSRHGFECIKTFGRRYLSISRAQSGPDDAVAAAREVNNFLLDHQSFVGTVTGQRSLRAFVHCGTVSLGLVQPSRLNLDILGEPMETLNALATFAADQLMVSIIISTAAQRRMLNPSGAIATAAGPDTTIHILPL
jgi:class 3 adenylate cyclase